MKIFKALLLSSLLIFCITPAYAEIYVWTDDQGTINFTEDLGTVPTKHRKNIRKFGDEEPALVQNSGPSAVTVKSPEVPNQAVPKVASEGAAPSGVSSGKSYDQWKKDIEDREAAMSALKSRMEDIAYRLKNVAARKEEQEKLVEEHKVLLLQFNELKKQYNQQVEKARKEGMSIVIQK